MTCPICKQGEARRSRRQTISDYVLSALGLLPWRCRQCNLRFYARLMPLSDSFHAHCPICGNLELKRISGDYVGGPLAFAWRILQIPAFRCEPCRYKYFSLLPLRESEEAVNLSSAE
jgi:C4-type Zn-finger protein